jgi:Ca2+:H+ antiporter
MGKFFFFLLFAVPLAFGAQLLGLSPALVFVLSAVAVVPLAKYIGQATEELATRTTPALGGLLNAAFGNAPELIIGLFALHAGLIDLVKASIAGSILSNLLFVLGVAMLAGGWKREKQSFNKTAVMANGSTLFLVAIALVVPAIFAYTAPGAGSAVVERLSIAVSLLLLCVYAMSLVFSLRTHKHLYLEEVGKVEARWSLKYSLLVLCTSTAAVALMSNSLVSSVEPLVESWGWSQLFIGVIVIALIGNAAEHYSAVVVALKNRMDLSLQIAIGSAMQIPMVVAPLLLLASLLLPVHMNLVFDTFELICIVLSVSIVNLVIADGESNWLEGLQLVAAYAIVAVSFFFHP